MNRKQSFVGAASAFLSALALGAFLVTAPATVCAEEFGCTCEYGGDNYSHGACVDSCPQEGEVQQCKEGRFTGCAPDCGDLGECEAEG